MADDTGTAATLDRPDSAAPAGTAQVAAAGGSREGGTAELAADLAAKERGAPAEPAAEEAPLFPAEEAEALRSQWQDVQASFVDEPRQAVERADQLVAGAIKRLAETFAAERAKLEAQWDRGDEVSTEDLRLALQRYRSFFGRLLAV